MKLNLINKLGGGAFADVWFANDELEREVAVKIIRPASEEIADALSHAKALARARHDNIVAVITLEKTQDPESGEEVDCVVMELLDGVTLTERLKGDKLAADEVQVLGKGIINGIIHIHAQGMAHGDLHTENVMIVDGVAKIIDILYLNSLATISTETRESRLKRDLVSLRLILQQLLVHSEFDPAEATEFNNLLDVDASSQDMRDAFSQIVSSDDNSRDTRILEHTYARFTDADFIEGEAYAAALDEETPDSIILPLLRKIAEEKTYDYNRRDYIQALWARLSPEYRTEFLTTLNTVIDEETPKGTWAPGLRLLVTLKSDGWPVLSKLVKLKLEGLIVKDVLAGYKDIHSFKAISGGALGTYAISLWQFFDDPATLADNLISLLRQGWYTQNYVGSFFIQTIPILAEATNKRSEFIEAIKIAVRNDARLIVNKLEEFPVDWVADIRKKEE